MRGARSDAGVTLLELLVAMAVMSVAGVISTAAIVQTYQVTNRADAAAAAQAQLNVVFLRLDKEIRYAAGVSNPGAVGPDRYVEYLTANAGTQTCGQLRLNGGRSQLQWRSWTRGDNPGTWTVLASRVSSTTPFALRATGPGERFQSLTISLRSAAAGLARDSTVTFTALNTTPTTDSSGYCVEGRSAP